MEVRSTRKKLTEKQKKFVKEYLLDFNGARAARAAGYSEKTADSMAYENLRKPEIMEYISKQQEKKKEKFDITEESIMNELAAIAFSRATDYAQISPKMSRDGYIRPVVDFTNTEELSEQQKVAISEISMSEKGNIKVKLFEKVSALKLLGMQIGMFKDNVNLSGKVSNELTAEDRKLLEKVSKRLDAK